MNNKKNKFCFTNEQLEQITSKDDLFDHLKKNNVPIRKIQETIRYNEELHNLQVELLKLQNWIRKKKKRVVIVFEGRDAAGKGGTIRRFTRFLNPRSMRVVALNKPTSVERGQWYFRRHVKELPNPGEIVFFDRSWYNRAVVEPVMGFCTTAEYQEFIRQVPEFEHMLFENGVVFIKFWFSISQKVQEKRLKSRQTDPLKQWKLSPIDLESRKYWDKYTYYKEEMFIKTHSSFAPWTIIKSNNKKIARLEAIRYVLSRFPYNGKDENHAMLSPDPNIVLRFHRSIIST